MKQMKQKTDKKRLFKIQENSGPGKGRRGLIINNKKRRSSVEKIRRTRDTREGKKSD